MVVFVHDARFGRIGHYVFLYNSEEFVARLNRLPRTGPRPTYSVQSLLPDRMSTGHLIRGAMSIIPPDLNHGDIGIFATAHTAGAQSTAHTSTAQRSSFNIGGSLFATPSESSRSRLDYHDSIAPRIPGAQLTASSPTLQQTSTDTGGGPSAASTNNLTNATHPHIQGYVPPTAFAPDTSFTQSPGAYPDSDVDASGRLSSDDWTFNNPYPGIRPRPQPADARPKDESSISYANHTIALEPSQTTRKAPSQAQASTDSARAGASSASAALDTRESWGTRLRETILAEAALLRFPLPTPATGGAPPFNPQSQFMTAPAPAPARAGMSPSLATLQDQGVTGCIRPPRPRRSAGSGQDGRQVSQSRTAAPHGGHTTSGLRPSLQAQAMSGSDGAGSSASRPATSQADTMYGPAGFPLLPPYQRHPAAPVTAGARGPSLPATLRVQYTTPPAPAGAGMIDFARHDLFSTSASSRPQLTLQPAQDGRQAPQPNYSAAAALRRVNADLQEFMKTLPTTGSGGVDNSARPITSQTQSMTASAEPGSSPDSAIVIDNQVTFTPATGAGRAPTLPGNLQATSLTASAGHGSPNIPVNPQAASTPATGGDGGGVSLPPVTDASQAQSLTASTETGMPTLPVDPQVISAAAMDRDGVSSFSGAPKAASITDAGSDSSGGPPGKKRKLGEEKAKSSQRRTKK